MVKRVTRRQALRTGAAASAVFSAATILAPKRSFAARDEKLVYWHLPTFTPLADESTREQFEEFRKAAGLSEKEAAFVNVSNKDLIAQLNAGLEVGNPPDAVRLYESFVQLYRSQGQLLDVTDVVDEMQSVEGGIFESSLRAVTNGGRAWGVPYALNPWPMHARVDILEQHKLDYPKTWDEFVETCLKVQKPPFFGFGMDLGLTADATDNIMQVCWCYGGFTADEAGNAQFDNPGNVAGFEFINSMYNEHRIIPRGVVGNGETAWNNKVYQSGQVAFINNPTSVYAYLTAEDPELQSQTGLFGVPAGPAGAINQIDTWSTAIFKNAPEPELAKEFVRTLMEPETYNDVIIKTNGRFVPVYPRLFEDPWWTSRPQFKEFITIAKTGVPVSFKDSPSAGSGEVLATHVIPAAVQEMVVNEVPAADAVGQAAAKIAAIYERANG